MNRVRARWVYPGIGSPLPNATVTMEAGRIVNVDADDNSPAIELGDVALIPGLINLHTHLEFSELQNPIEPRERFADWIAAVIQNRRERPPSTSISEAIQQGIHESQGAGVVAIAETATSDWLFDLPQQDFPSRLLVFREILGLRAEAIDTNLATAESFLQRARVAGLPVGLSPHAPYSLHPELFTALCDLAVRERVPLSMHLAESPAEIDLLSNGQGPLVDLFDRMGIWHPGTIRLGSRPLDYLKELSRAPRALVIHGNYLDDEEIAFIAQHPRMTVTWCPRTHDAMQQGEHPWKKMIAAGVRVTVGTDSRASNPDLSIWEELRFLKESSPGLKTSQLLQFATSNAAQAMGWDDLGEISPGKIAELATVQLSSEAIADPEEELLRDRGVAPARLSV